MVLHHKDKQQVLLCASKKQLINYESDIHTCGWKATI